MTAMDMTVASITTSQSLAASFSLQTTERMMTLTVVMKNDSSAAPFRIKMERTIVTMTSLVIAAMTPIEQAYSCTLHVKGGGYDQTITTV